VSEHHFSRARHIINHPPSHSVFISTTGFFLSLTDGDLIELCFVTEHLLDLYCVIPMVVGRERAGGETMNKDRNVHRGNKCGRVKCAAPQFRSISRPNIPAVISSSFEIVE
jgi:hypothetical protein